MSALTSNATTVKPHSSVRIEVTEYDPITGEKTRKLDSLNFDRTSLEQLSVPIVIKMNVAGAQKINNIKIGIVKSSETISGSGIANSDGSVPNGNVGIEHSTSLVNKKTLSSSFSGMNSSGSPANNNNVSINNSTDTESEYIYLDVKMPTETKRGYIGFKWFFDFV